MVSAELVMPTSYLGAVITMLEEKRGTQTDLVFMDEETIRLTYLMVGDCSSTVHPFTTNRSVWMGGSVAALVFVSWA
jgi:translation elongation factor EF-4